MVFVVIAAAFFVLCSNTVVAADNIHVLQMDRCLVGCWMDQHGQLDGCFFFLRLMDEKCKKILNWNF